MTGAGFEGDGGAPRLGAGVREPGSGWGGERYGGGSCEGRSPSYQRFFLAKIYQTVKKTNFYSLICEQHRR